MRVSRAGIRLWDCSVPLAYCAATNSVTRTPTKTTAISMCCSTSRCELVHTFFKCLTALMPANSRCTVAVVSMSPDMLYSSPAVLAPPPVRDLPVGHPQRGLLFCPCSVTWIRHGLPVGPGLRPLTCLRMLPISVRCSSFQGLSSPLSLVNF